ncbi:MAG: tetratricopeptide repeat protein [Meiothermus sp.]|nr:tetratricopeptide repeat protein [Meiothermus sp.]
MLRTLGGLELHGSSLKRGKNLLLLAYLALEGVKPRRFLAELFWPDAADPMNSLKVVLHRLRQAEVVWADEEKAWVRLESDASQMRELLRAGKALEASRLYRGAFLDGVGGDAGEELEDWIFTTRETLAREMRWGLVELAERYAAGGDFARGAEAAEQAYGLAGAPPPEPEELLRLYPLLVAGSNPLAETVRREAAELGVTLTASSEVARGRLRQSFVGRAREIETLLALPLGEWAWLRGAAGMGKTSLFKHLVRQAERQGAAYIPARQGLPYATLEPLLGAAISGTPEELLRRLSALEGFWLVDGWENTDLESRELLTRLRGLRSKARVVVASRSNPPFAVDHQLQLRPLSEAELEPYPDLWESTGGVPSLVGAYMRQETLEQALANRLNALPETPRGVFAALALLENPDFSLARRALGKTSVEVAQAVEELIQGGLIEPSGKLIARPLALKWLGAYPSLETPLTMSLAQLLPPLEAFPLYQHIRAMSDVDELAGMRAAYLAWAGELLGRGFPQKAVEVLREITPDPQLNAVLARALERSGQYKGALDTLSDVPESPETFALKGALLWRLGKPEEARGAAEKALEGDMRPRAEALNTLGQLALSTGEFEVAVDNFQRAAGLWRTLGEQGRFVGALNNVAHARSQMGQSVEEAFKDVLDVARDNELLKALVLLNIGQSYERTSDFATAKKNYLEAAETSLRAGGLSAASRAWNNLGVIAHKQDKVEEAEESYRQALALARQAGEVLSVATILGNLSELLEDEHSLEEAILLLEKSRNFDMAKRFAGSLEALRSRKGNGSPV